MLSYLVGALAMIAPLRYLTAADAPPDLAAIAGMPDAAAGALPERMIAELRSLGLW